MERNEYKNAIANLKLRLQKNKITYRELAAGIGLSESGIKKIFTASDGSIQRLAQICEYVGISLSEIFVSEDVVDVSFSPRQQNEFLKNPLSFEIFWRLVYERRNPAQVLTETKISEKDLFKVLRRLDTLELIKLLPGDRVQVPAVIGVRWTGADPFVKKMYRLWSQKLISQVAKPELEENELFIIRYFQMTARTRQDFMAAQTALEQEFLRRSIAEMRSQPSEKLEHIRWVVGADTRSFVS